MSTPKATPASHVSLMRRMHELDIIRLRGELLGRKDKILIQMVFDNGSTFEQVARLTGQNPSSISRRVHTLQQKLIARELVWLVRRKEFDESAVKVLQEYYLRGLSQRSIARKFGVSLYRVARTLRTARSIAYGADAGSGGQNQTTPSTRRGTKGASHAHIEGSHDTGLESAADRSHRSVDTSVRTAAQSSPGTAAAS